MEAKANILNGARFECGLLELKSRVSLDTAEKSKPNIRAGNSSKERIVQRMIQ